MEDNKTIIKELRAHDLSCTRNCFYSNCMRAYRVYDRMYHLSSKSGLDFFSLAHDYYIQLALENFASFERCPEGISLKDWMFGAFRYFILNALRRYNREYGKLADIEPDQLFSQINSSPIEDLIPNVISEVEKSYRDEVMSRIADMLFRQGYKQNEVAKELIITPSAVSQRYKRMMEEVVIPYVYATYPDGIPQEIVVKESWPKYSAIVEGGFRFRMAEPILIQAAEGRVTPGSVTELRPGQIFVFGSDLNGLFLNKSAQQALRFGAVKGQGVGIQGQTYAIPTLSGNLDNLRQYVDAFVSYAEHNPDLRFLVGEIGCGLAGYKVSDIAPLFEPAIKVPNISLPEAFWTEYDLERPESHSHWRE